MNATILPYVTLRDYHPPHPEGWAMSLVRLGHTKLRAYLEDPAHLLRSRGGDRDALSLAGDLFDRAKRDHPNLHISLDEITDDHLLYFGRRFPVLRKRRVTQAA